MTEKRFTGVYIKDGLVELGDNGIVKVCPNERLEELLNELSNENEQLKKENKHLQCTIESNSQDDYIDFLEKQNERLKERIEELASHDKIVFMVNE